VKVLVTGGAGFIGSYLVERLLGEGYKVIVVDNLSSGSLNNLKDVIGDPNLVFRRADVRSLDKWIDLLNGVDIVFHYAANPEVRHSVREPLDHYDQNLTATMLVLEACRRKGVSFIVFASSSTVYGDAEKIPTPEDYPLKPISVYGATKAAAEIMCQTYARLYNLKCLILRYANIIGPRTSHGVVYDFLVKLSKNPKKLEILGDGSQRKSYLYIDDTIEATMRAVEYFTNTNLVEEVFNIGNVDWVSVKEIADIVVNVLGLEDVEYVFKPGTSDGRGWPGDVKLMLLDIAKIRRATGWSPTHSSREAVRLTAEALARRLGLK